MPQLMIQIPEAVYHSLQVRAKQLGKTPELVAAECVVQSVRSVVDDSLIK